MNTRTSRKTKAISFKTVSRGKDDDDDDSAGVTRSATLQTQYMPLLLVTGEEHMNVSCLCRH